MNVAALLRMRERARDAVRRFFKREGFIEVETPLLVPSPGLEPHLDPFVVRKAEETGAGKTGTDNFLSLREKSYLSPFFPPSLPSATSAAIGGPFLPTSPEYAMKKLLAAGSGSIFQIAYAFRDEPPSDHHRPEFTMLEWYRVGVDYHAAMDDCERLCAAVADAVGRPDGLDLTPPFERLGVRDAFRRHAGVELTFAESRDELAALAQRAGCTDLAPDDDWDDVFFKLFLRRVEPRLGRPKPTLLFDYPARMAALSRLKPGDPDVCERFELYAGGLELANAFSELTDPAEQRRRFESDNAKRRELGKPELPIDEELLAALERGLPDCAGVALGLDRLLMLLTGATDIREVISDQWSVISHQ